MQSGEQADRAGGVFSRIFAAGLLSDSAQRFVPLADLKRQIQGMASAKLNVLHWHLTDDQGWR